MTGNDFQNWIRVDKDGNIIGDIGFLPKSWIVPDGPTYCGGFQNLDVEQLIEYGWYPVEEILPSYDINTQILTGLKGDQGLKGDKGDNLSFSDLTTIQKAELKGDQGIQGIQGSQGLKGDQGDRGLQGLKGDQGERGLTGANGQDSIIPGPKGDQGNPGQNGSDASVTKANVENVLTGIITTHSHIQNLINVTLSLGIINN